MQIIVAVDGVDHSISPTAGDLVRLERAYSMRATELSEETVSIEHVLYLAWCALRRTHGIPDEMDFDSFIDLADVPEASSLRPPAPLPLT